MSARRRYLLLGLALWIATIGLQTAHDALAGGEPTAEVRGVTRRDGVRGAMRVEVRRLPVEPPSVPLFHAAWRRALPIEWQSPGFVEADALAATTSDGQGRYRIDGLPRGHYEIRAVTDDGVRTFAQLTVRGRGGEYLVDLGVAPGALSVSGLARHQDGRPFVGWLVVTQASEGRIASPWLHGGDAVRTDKEGRFTVRGLLDGPVAIEVVLPGRGRAPCLDLLRPTAAAVELIVDPEAVRIPQDVVPGAAVTGRVLAVGDGGPAAGACVHLMRAADGDCPQVRIADADGRFGFRDVPVEPFRLLVAGGGWLDADGDSVMHSRRVQRGRELAITLRALRAVETATVRVVDQKGHPCPGVEVRGRQPHIPHYHAYVRVHGVLAPAVTDANGLCRIGPFVPDKPISVTLAHPWHAVFARDRGAVQPGEHLLAHVRRVRGATGRVELPVGITPRRVRLTVEGLAQPEGTAHRLALPSDGSFRLPAGCEGYGLARAAAWRGEDHLAGRIRLRPPEKDESEPVLTLRRSPAEAAWRFRVLDPRGKPVPDGWVACTMRGAGHPGLEIERIDEGYADVACHAPDTRMVRAVFYEFRDRSGDPLPCRNHVVESPTAGFYTVHLAEGRELRVRVCDTAGEPLPGVLVKASLQEHWRAPGARAVTDRTGTARLLGLGAVAVEIRVETPRHFVEATPVEVAADATEATVVVVPFVAARLQVTRSDGSPVKGARVRASSATKGPTAFNGRGARRLVTDTDGRCQLPPLRPGVRIDLFADAPDEDLLPLEMRWWRPADQELVLPSADVLRGRVVDGRGHAIADATVWVRACPGSPKVCQWGRRWWCDADGFVLGTVTGPDGTFRIGRLEHGEVELRAVTRSSDGNDLASEVVVVGTDRSDLLVRIR